MQDGIPRTFLSLFLIVAAAWQSPRAAASASPAPVLNGGETFQASNAGFYTLAWSLPDRGSGASGALLFEVVQSASRDFSEYEVIYQGPDLSKALSGQPDGRYYYRVRALYPRRGGGPWSNVYEVEVEHHPLTRAFAFLATGAIVFLATAALIFSGHSKAAREEGAA